jgi:dTDP-4-amino-4,6-dideoxygalactose transaminase
LLRDLPVVPLSVPLASPLAQYRAHEKDVRAAIGRVLDSGSYILGAEVESFERDFASYCGVTHAVGVGSGTDALILALKALDIGAGDEVITVSHTAVATVAAIIACAATPVLVDIDPVYYTIDPAAIAAAITPRSKAIIAVHLYGQTAALDDVAAIARAHGLFVLEDCAQAAGARYHGRRVGSIGDIGCFSFYPTKNLGAIGDAGMVVTSDDSLASRVRRLRQYGWDDGRLTHEVGVNSRLDPLQAAILAAKLPYLDADNARRATLAQHYAKGLTGLPITLPALRPHATHAFHLYVGACAMRDELMAHLANRGVGCGIHYPAPVHRQKGYVGRVALPPHGLPITEQLVTRIVSLPMYPELMDAEVDTAIAAVRGFMESSFSED